MKRVARFWKKRSDYEKAMIGLGMGFVLFCLGYFSSWMYSKARCDICCRKLRNGEHYILDVRTGETLNLSGYVDQEYDCVWRSETNQLLQEVSATYRRGYMRFSHHAAQTAHYCSNHTANLNSDFLMLAPTEGAIVCYAVLDGQNLDPDGRRITRRLNEALDCWEMEIQWDVNIPVTSS